MAFVTVKSVYKLKESRSNKKWPLEFFSTKFSSECRMPLANFLSLFVEGLLCPPQTPFMQPAEPKHSLTPRAYRVSVGDERACNSKPAQ